MAIEIRGKALTHLTALRELLKGQYLLRKNQGMNRDNDRKRPTKRLSYNMGGKSLRKLRHGI